MSNPDRRVHATETFMAALCVAGLIVVLVLCGGMILDAYWPQP